MCINRVSWITFIDANCASMLHARGAETICLHMNEPDPSGQVLLLSSEILCNLLERGNKEEVSAQLSSLDCVLYVSYANQSNSRQKTVISSSFVKT